MRSLGYGAVVLSTFFWGSTFPAIKLLLGELSPLPILVLRFGLGTLAYLVLLAAVNRGRPVWPRWSQRRLILVAVFGPALNSLGVFFAVSFLGAGISSLVIMLVPVLTGVLAWLAGQERPTARKLQGFAVALVGLIVVVLWGGPGAAINGARVVGLLLMLAGALGFAVYNVYSKPLFAHYTPIEVTAYLGILASLGLVPFLVYPPIWRDLAAIGGLSPGGWSLAVYIAAGSSVAANLGWYWALQRLESTRVALFTYLIPVWGLTTSALLLHEPITLWLPVGVVLVVVGIVVASRAPARPATPAAKTELVRPKP